MRSVSLLLALVGFLLVRAAEVEVEENVLVVTQDNFQQIVDENEFVLMEFCKWEGVWRGLSCLGFALCMQHKLHKHFNSCLSRLICSCLYLLFVVN